MFNRIYDPTLAVGVGGFSLGAWLTKYSGELGGLVLFLTAIHLSIKIYKELRSVRLEKE